MEVLKTNGGVQLLDRAVGVLRHLAAAGERGERLSSVAQALELSVPTAHRILSALEGHGLVEREVATRRFRLGVGLFSLGAQAADGTDRGAPRASRTNAAPWVIIRIGT